MAAGRGIRVKLGFRCLKDKDGGRKGNQGEIRDQLKGKKATGCGNQGLGVLKGKDGGWKGNQGEIRNQVF